VIKIPYVYLWKIAREILLDRHALNLLIRQKIIFGGTTNTTKKKWTLISRISGQSETLQFEDPMVSSPPKFKKVSVAMYTRIRVAHSLTRPMLQPASSRSNEA